MLASVTVYEYSGMTITKKVSATFRVVIEVIKVLFVWIFEIIYYDSPKFKSMNMKSYALVTLMKTIGYAFIIFGNILVNEIFVIRFCNLDKYYGNLYI